MADLFREIIPSILQTKKYALVNDQDERQYPHFMVGRAMSNYSDTALAANEINKYPNLDNKLKYDFLINIIKPYKRQYASWHKRVKIDDLDVVKEYYGYSDAKAHEALLVLSDEQIADIRKRTYKGE